MKPGKTPVLTDAQKKAVIDALERGMHVHLHRETGEFLLQDGETLDFPRGDFEDEDVEALRQDLEAHPQDFVVARAPGSFDTYGWMKEFANQRASAGVQDALLDRLSHRRPFVSFMDFLHTSAPAAVLAQWKAFLALRMDAHLASELSSFDNREGAWADLDDDDEDEADEDLEDPENEEDDEL